MSLDLATCLFWTRDLVISSSAASSSWRSRRPPHDSSHSTVLMMMMTTMMMVVVQGGDPARLEVELQVQVGGVAVAAVRHLVTVMVSFLIEPPAVAS